MRRPFFHNAGGLTMSQYYHHTAAKPLPWERLGFGYYRAEPAPGLVFRISPAPDGVGVVFNVPGHAQAQAMRASIARVSCELYWQRLFPRVVAPWQTITG